MGPALEGVLVLDLTSEFYASLAGALLGDFGATVIRVESESRPDNLRGLVGFYPFF